MINFTVHSNNLLIFLWYRHLHTLILECRFEEAVKDLKSVSSSYDNTMLQNYTNLRNIQGMVSGKKYFY